MNLREVFGDNPWVVGAGVTAPRVGFQLCNPIYFATERTAMILAEILGGRIEEVNDMIKFGPSEQSQPNRMIRMSKLENEEEGRLLNAGLIADMFNHNHSQETIDRLISDLVGFTFTWPT